MSTDVLLQILYIESAETTQELCSCIIRRKLDHPKLAILLHVPG